MIANKCINYVGKVSPVRLAGSSDRLATRCCRWLSLITVVMRNSKCGVKLEYMSVQGYYTSGT